MLYMVIATHSPKICPVGNKESRKTILANYQRLPEVMKKLNIATQGSWTYMPGHQVYLLLDAPNAHIINQMSFLQNYFELIRNWSGNSLRTSIFRFIFPKSVNSFAIFTHHSYFCQFMSIPLP